MKHFTRYLYLISGVTLTTLYIPFFILLNQQDSSYETIYDGVSLQGVEFWISMSDIHDSLSLAWQDLRSRMLLRTPRL